MYQMRKNTIFADKSSPFANCLACIWLAIVLTLTQFTRQTRQTGNILSYSAKGLCWISCIYTCVFICVLFAFKNVHSWRATVGKWSQLVSKKTIFCVNDAHLCPICGKWKFYTTIQLLKIQLISMVN